jgi:hypothetical protein
MAATIQLSSRARMLFAILQGYATKLSNGSGDFRAQYDTKPSVGARVVIRSRYGPSRMGQASAALADDQRIATSPTP